jgi:hypothetical protein
LRSSWTTAKWMSNQPALWTLGIKGRGQPTWKGWKVGDSLSTRTVHNVAYLLKARTVKPSKTAVTRERFCKHALW